MGNTDLTGRTAVVTGAGAGLGRAEALALAARGADVVVNDMGDAADDVVREIEELGSRALAVKGDIGTWEMGQQLVDAAVDTFGGLDIVVNNAGITRDTMLFNMSEQQWDDVIRVHLKGHASLSRAASVHFRAASKAAGGPVYGRIINTASEAFLFGAPGQSNYAAAKAGIVALTLSTSRGMARYGVTANAICPRARTEMTSRVFAEDPESRELDILAPERIGTFVSYLASEAAARISGQVFVAYGDFVALMAAPTVEQKFTAADGTFSVEELDEQLTSYFADRSEHQTYAAYSVAKLDTTGVESLNG
ncbi:SDR family NAD(P)-dependent oxidoreductase [Nocardioides sp. zg-DK7169]|uniref:SDR family NAD(P)-dependent oxidoreductase n=1 Tax=Nocardioides sp. zg-DK7169 TaxID=2736600 RepID=UPI001557C8A9|nr:SDR family NAD(P)-dependent oxidoreductase [Nocardioides sp. zg-DK7169]NPC98664.1 SDR family NAD(P)-dependent oxidoreductase [Nocardioides sp. zg-DK7169]